ncbi:hypothetical protein BJX68DRAFT_262184 [Aspergillus pseudodeflectus]|uniref:Uncharacterized protein n=1 Tax=Aspergillus pseudodeflectus TaxID=176178 RepID=A0ABR4L286_9EURO
MPTKLQTQSKTAGRLAQIVDTWSYECLTMIFSLACFGAVVSLLVVTDGKPPPSFAYGLTLNAIVSLLGTACKSSLIFVIGECIGQLKWTWFYNGSSETQKKKSKQHLDGMQLFDTASRGLLGSLFILLEHKGQSLVSLGALVIVLALIFDPFMQQLVRYPVREIEFVNSSSAAAPQTVVLPPENLTADTRSIMYTGIWSEEFKSVLRVPLGTALGSPSSPSECAASQIVWTPYYQSLGSPGSNATYMGVRNPLYVLAHAELEFANKNMAGTEPMLDLRQTFRLKNVTQRVLSLCSRTYTMSVSNGDYSVETSPPDYGTMDQHRQHRAHHRIDLELRNRAEFAFCPTDTYCLYDYFDEELTQYNGSSGFSELGPSDIPETYGKPDKWDNPQDADSRSDRDANTATIRGTVRLTEIYVSVRWLWLVFPSALVALGLVFLGLTMLTNGRRGLRLWKSSILAILFHGLEGFMGEDEDEDDRFATDSRMDRAARGMEVSLEVVERRKGLVLNCS